MYYHYSSPRLRPNETLSQLLDGKQKMLKMIDFGRSIDMRQYKPGTTFTASVDTSGFQCIEMKTHQPWTYQTDLFGVAGTLYVLIFQKYMQIAYVNAKDQWVTSGNFQR